MITGQEKIGPTPLLKETNWPKESVTVKLGRTKITRE